MHAHRIPTDSYDFLFKSLSEIPKDQRIFRNKGNFIGFPLLQAFEGGYFLQAIEGVEGEAPLIFDVLSGTTRTDDLPQNEVFAHATHVFVLAKKRRALVEYVHRGPKSARIGSALEAIARAHVDNFESMRIEFTPIIADGFASQIASFVRIREASIRVVRPNASWSDHYTKLSTLVEESGGSSAEVDIRAGRGESLSKDKGIVEVINDVVKDQEPYLQEASITGTRNGEVGETTVRASKFVAQTQVRVQADQSKNVAPTDIRGRLAQIADSFSQRFR